MERFVITGPSGWIGQVVLAQLAEDLGDRFAGQVTAFGSHARHLPLPGTPGLEVRALDTLTGADVVGAHVIHLAYLTREKADELGEREFTALNVAIDDQVLQAARAGRPASLFVASSGAAAVALTDTALNPYGLCKLRQEQRFLDLARELSLPTVVGRVFNIAGPYINKQQFYAISNMLLQAAQTGEIRIAAQHPVYRSFLHVGDLAQIIVTAARKLHCEVVPIDLCGTQVLEMGDLATAVNQLLGGGIKITRAAIDFSQCSTYLGNCTYTHALALKLELSMRPFSIQLEDTWDWIRVRSAGQHY